MNELAGPTRARLIHAAAELFLARSYASVGVHEVCRAAGANKGSLYHFFPTKAALVIAVIEQHAAALWAAHERHEETAVGSAGRLRACADVVEQWHLELHRVHGRVVGCPLGNLALELPTTELAAATHLSAVFTRWQQRITRHCHDVAEARLLRRGVEPEVLGAAILAAVQGAALLAKVTGTGPEPIAAAPRRVIESALATSWGG